MAVVRYGFARLSLVALVTGLLVLAGVPLLVALLVALVVALPLALLLCRGLRRDLDEALAAVWARRSAHRRRLRAQLRGEPVPGSGQAAAREADRGAGRPDEQHDGGLAEHGDQRSASDSAEHPPHR